MKGLISGIFIGIAFKLSPAVNFDEPIAMGLIVGLTLGLIVTIIQDYTKSKKDALVSQNTKEEKSE